ncbi:MAG: methyltransferase domain-containing protein [Rhodocyclaceae bacterium]|nr:methyltransferase domain-containing protein [Rhodocyclaceae bacterium]MCA4901761.1 methyltransferase domain-containing protein [Rhodocyclaceae bacterium]
MKTNSCNVCGSRLGSPLYESADNASITTMNTVIEGRTRVFFCDECGHLQTSELPNLSQYYAQEYAINLASDEDDQLYKVIDGKPVYRAAHQAATALAKLDLRPGQAVLDYGCAKAPTLKRMVAAVPGIVPMTFDVTDKYVGFWNSFVAPEDQAVGTPAARWHGKVDFVLSFYALEHVADLPEALAAVRALLRPGGVFYFIVPNVYANVADFVVADHVNHFSASSIGAMLVRHGFLAESIDADAHDAAFVVVARRVDAAHSPAAPAPGGHRDDVAAARRLCAGMGRFWSNAAAGIRAFEASTPPPARLAIYGAGFYGNFIASSLARPERIECFIDQNRHLQGRKAFDRPIVPPEQLPSAVDAVLVGLNPRVARSIIGEIAAWRDRRLDVFFLEAT